VPLGQVGRDLLQRGEVSINIREAAFMVFTDRWLAPAACHAPMVRRACRGLRSS
jgi:hypothetical protein